MKVVKRPPGRAGNGSRIKPKGGSPACLNIGKADLACITQAGIDSILVYRFVHPYFQYASDQRFAEGNNKFRRLCHHRNLRGGRRDVSLLLPLVLFVYIFLFFRSFPKISFVLGLLVG